MTWIKLDDRAPRHPKVAGLTDRAFRWWVLGLCYASEFLTNGVLPGVFWKQVPPSVRSELSGCGLWDWEDPNFLIHDYLAHQSSRQAVEKKRADTADRVARYREGKRNAVSNAVTNAPVTPPENREQRTDTEKKTPPRPLTTKRNLHAEFEHPRFDVPTTWHLRAAKGLANGESRLLKFYGWLAERVERTNEDTLPRFEWLDRCFAEWMESTRVTAAPSSARPASLQVIDQMEAKRRAS